MVSKNTVLGAIAILLVAAAGFAVASGNASESLDEATAHVECKIKDLRKETRDGEKPERPATKEERKALKEARNAQKEERKAEKEASKESFKACKDRLKAERRDAREARRDFAPFKEDGALVVGRHVSFERDLANGTLLGYTSRGPMGDVVLFDSIAMSAHGAVVDGLRGPGYGVRDEAYGLLAFNAPNAAFFVKAKADETVTLDLGDGLGAVLDANGTVATLSHDGHEATVRIAGNGTMSLADGVLTATMDGGDVLVFHVDGYPRLLHKEREVARKLVARDA